MISIWINNGICYGLDLVTDSIYLIDLDTAELTLLGPTGLNLNYTQDMAFDKDNDTLYSAGYTSYGALYLCNTTNGNCNFVGNFEGEAEVNGLAILYYNYNQPPNAPSISVPDKVPRGKMFKLEVATNDPDGDDVYYRDEFNGFVS